MSTATFPLGTKSYNNNPYGTRGTGQYSSWKGTGQYSYPVAVASGNIRPLTNKDYSNPENYATQKTGLPRPLKWQNRKGHTIRSETTVNRMASSSRSSSLIGQTIDRPGQFVVKQNPTTEIDGIQQLKEDCKNCDGVGLIVDYKPETSFTDVPQPSTQSAQLCCNEEQKARRRALPANTNLPKTYFTSLQQYRENRCQTYDQRAFNFQTNRENDAELIASGAVTAEQLKYSKPGDPLSLRNLYVANCYPGTETSAQLPRGLQDPSNPRGCKQVYYKPSNYQYATQGGVSSSSRTLRLTVNTISSNLASIRKLKGSGATTNVGGQPFTPFIYKNKVEQANCNKLPYLRRENLIQNKTVCVPLNKLGVYQDYT